MGTWCHRADFTSFIIALHYDKFQSTVCGAILCAGWSKCKEICFIYRVVPPVDEL